MYVNNYSYMISDIPTQSSLCVLYLVQVLINSEDIYPEVSWFKNCLFFIFLTKFMWKRTRTYRGLKIDHHSSSEQSQKPLGFTITHLYSTRRVETPVKITYLCNPQKKPKVLLTPWLWPAWPPKQQGRCENFFRYNLASNIPHGTSIFTLTSSHLLKEDMDSCDDGCWV